MLPPTESAPGRAPLMQPPDSPHPIREITMQVAENGLVCPAMLKLQVRQDQELAQSVDMRRAELAESEDRIMRKRLLCVERHRHRLSAST